MTTTTARQVRINETGSADVLNIDTVEIREPISGEVRIKVEAIGLNRAEVMYREGQYLEQAEFPSGLGYEASGVVESVGEGVTEFCIGDRVSSIPAFSMNDYASYADIALFPVYALAKYPARYSPIEGTAIWMQYLTAYGALLHIAQLQKGQTVLITAASSSVGLASIQMAKAIGAKVVAATRGVGKHNDLLEAGADELVDITEPNWTDSFSANNSKGADVVFDPIGGPIIEQLAEVAAQGATIIEYGALSTEASPFPLFSALAKGLTIRGYTLFEVTKDQQLLLTAKQYVNDFLSANDISPTIDSVFDFEQVREAHRYMESNQQVGKIVLRVTA